MTKRFPRLHADIFLHFDEGELPVDVEYRQRMASEDSRDAAVSYHPFRHTAYGHSAVVRLVERPGEPDPRRRIVGTLIGPLANNEVSLLQQGSTLEELGQTRHGAQAVEFVVAPDERVETVIVQAITDSPFNRPRA